ncbi:hypothetical protein EDI_213690 [Entamoeba dispar SAW760]|uniref:Uncharacterized protein n=1 Tax=Entamoeba dispar (strain ATCC PRA-260 / SAW760) TaxID=370354 RepID=B0E846_ENTDS|nr:uncharacterized protein EDI_213690 [Entamoeba dispar SAW760]EDR29294.1 hypothetical protein EDI_213690 [Entamoeba dispar SAW760]|eukprot:EDR29294.1 hypothetical protein EDI_213690 [Entamoeba dispar SAW760]
MSRATKVQKKSDSERLCEKYFEIRNYLMCQQGVLLLLLNQHFDITITRPTKKSLVTGQVIKVKTLRDKFAEVDVVDFVEERCKEKMRVDMANGINEISACRRYTNNKIAENHHLLLDMLRMYGITFNTTFSSGKHNSTKLETISEIFINSKVLFTKNQIKAIGKEINNYFFNLVDKEKEVVLEKNNQFLQSFSIYHQDSSSC